MGESIDRFLAIYNEDAAPFAFEWTKSEVHPTPIRKLRRFMQVSTRQQLSIGHVIMAFELGGIVFYPNDAVHLPPTVTPHSLRSR